MADGQPEFALLCPHCGEANPPEFPVCWSCHGDLPAPGAAIAAPAAATAPSLDPEKRLRRRRRITVELVVALLLLWAPKFVSVLLPAGESHPDRDLAGEVFWVVWYLGPLALLYYFGWLQGDWRRLYGLERPALGREALWTAIVWLAMHLAHTLTVVIAGRLELEDSESPDVGYEPNALWLAPVVYLISALFEESFYRAYLWTRLTELTGRPWLAIVIASMFFSLAHGYPPVASLSIFFIGVALTWIFWLRRSLWALVLGHCLFNLTLLYG